MTVAHGIDTRFFGAVEASLDAAMAAWSAANALPAVELKIEPALDWHRTKERLGSATIRSETRGYAGGKWSLVQELRTNAAGTAPPHDTPLRLAFGQAPTVVASTSVRYTLSTGLLTGAFARYVPTNLYEQCTGAWVEQVELELVGNQNPTLTFSGGFARYGWVFGGAMSTATIAAAATTFTLATTSIGKISEQVRIDIGTDTNSGSGYLVTAVNHTTGVVTFSPGLANQQTGATAITAHVPSMTLTGTVRGGINAGLDIGGTPDFGMISNKTTWKTGIHGLVKEATRERPGRIARGEREIMSEIVAYYLDDELARFGGRAFVGTVHDINARFGENTAGERMILQTPAMRLNVVPITIPNAEEATVKISGLARYSAANEDEFALMFN